MTTLEAIVREQAIDEQWRDVSGGAELGTGVPASAHRRALDELPDAILHNTYLLECRGRVFGTGYHVRLSLGGAGKNSVPPGMYLEGSALRATKPNTVSCIVTARHVFSNMSDMSRCTCRCETRPDIPEMDMNPGKFWRRWDRMPSSAPWTGT